MEDPPDPYEDPAPLMFWCRICRNILARDVASEVDRSIIVHGRVYPSGNCVKCVRQFRRVDTDDQLALRQALDELTDLRQLTTSGGIK